MARKRCTHFTQLERERVKAAHTRSSIYMLGKSWSVWAALIAFSRYRSDHRKALFSNAVPKIAII